MDYIEIKDQIIFTLKNMLTEARFYHCLRVAEEAQRLASRWGEEESKLYIAGLLHDCARDLPYQELIPLYLLIWERRFILFPLFFML